MEKPKVFVIMPFNDDFFALYEELKNRFKDDFEFANAGDLDNQQNILKDIVEGINAASVVIADLTRLNSNVFYELGLAHAMNKKVIIITQDINELPFDIKSYRVNEYSLQFNKVSKLIDELKKLLFGAVNGSIKYGNPVSDFIPDFYKKEEWIAVNSALGESMDEESLEKSEINSEEEQEKGFVDFIADLEENSKKMNMEIADMSSELNDMKIAIVGATNEIQRVKDKSGNVNGTFVREVFRKLADPIDVFADKMKIHIGNITNNWSIIENSYLSLLDNRYAKNPEQIIKSMKSLELMKTAINGSDKNIEELNGGLRNCLGMERRLNKAISKLVVEMEEYLSMTEKMVSSVDRIITKGNLVVGR